MQTGLRQESQRVKQGATASELDRLIVCIDSDVDLANDSGKTPADLAEIKGHEQMFVILQP